VSGWRAVSSKSDGTRFAAFLRFFRDLENAVTPASIEVLRRFDAMHLPKIQMAGP
jgi:hypothetical protein